MSEPRLTIRNVANSHILYNEHKHWTATIAEESKAGSQDAKFKVQWCERTEDKIVTVVMIRTDRHPQSLLDVRDLKYQGGALDGKKCHDKNRWWKLTWLEVGEGGVTTVLFQSFEEKGKYLVETEDGSGVELMHIDDDTHLESIPQRAKWELTIGGRALSPGQAAALGLLPLAAVVGAITGGSAAAAFAGPMAAAFSAAGITTLGTATAVITAGAVVSGISAAASEALKALMVDVSDALFVPW